MVTRPLATFFSPSSAPGRSLERSRESERSLEGSPSSARGKSERSLGRPPWSARGSPKDRSRESERSLEGVRKIARGKSLERSRESERSLQGSPSSARGKSERSLGRPPWRTLGAVLAKQLSGQHRNRTTFTKYRISIKLAHKDRHPL